MASTTDPPASFLWHDYETTGADTRRDRPLQFAAQRTDAKLEPIEDPIVLWCAPPQDTFPSPEAGLITGLTPQDVALRGQCEAQFAAAVNAVLAEPGTCGVGWNSIRFDDEITRNLLYRNLYDPYAREWEHGNSRWDLIDLARLCYALRPEGIRWPLRDDGAPSFKLTDLAAANGLSHQRAHDALSDVGATLAIAHLIRDRQPRLFDWHYSLRNKRRASEMLDWTQRTPVLHASQRYPAAQGCLAMVVPLAPHPVNNNGVIVYDLSADPSDLIELSPADIHDRVFVARADLPEGVARIPLKVVQINRSPALAPLSTLRDADAARLQLDRQRCADHLQRLREASGIAEKIRAVFSVGETARAPAADVDLAIYDGFLPNADKALLRKLRSTPPEQLARTALPFQDPRYTQLLFRLRARNWPQTLDADEALRWSEHRRRRLLGNDPGVVLNHAQYCARIATLREGASNSQHALLDQYLAWGEHLVEDLQ